MHARPPDPPGARERPDLDAPRRGALRRLVLRRLLLGGLRPLRPAVQVPRPLPERPLLRLRDGPPARGLPARRRARGRRHGAAELRGDRGTLARLRPRTGGAHPSRRGPVRRSDDRRQPLVARPRRTALGRGARPTIRGIVRRPVPRRGRARGARVPLRSPRRPRRDPPGPAPLIPETLPMKTLIAPALLTLIPAGAALSTEYKTDRALRVEVETDLQMETT